MTEDKPSYDELLERYRQSVKNYEDLKKDFRKFLHDVNSGLTPVLGHAELVKLQISNSAERGEMQTSIEAICSACNSLSGLVFRKQKELRRE